MQRVGLPFFFLLSFVSTRLDAGSPTAISTLSISLLIIWAISSVILAEISYRQAAKAKEQQKRFTADISHDLRTPTAALQTLLEVSQLDPALRAHRPAQDVFARALAQVHSISSLTDRLLRLSQLETTPPPHLTPVCLQPVVADAISQLEPLSQQKQQTITAEISPTLQVAASADELAQLVVILLDNAIKFSPPRASITITLRHTTSHVVVAVHDSGPGMTPEEHAHIFDRFYRADLSRHREDDSGFGLGLAIAAAIATRHGSKISVTSQPGSGTTFTFRLKRLSPA